MTIRNLVLTSAIRMAQKTDTAEGTGGADNSKVVTANGSVLPVAIMTKAHDTVFNTWEAIRTARKVTAGIGSMFLDLAKDCVREAQRMMKDRKWAKDEARSFAGKMFRQAVDAQELELQKEAKPAEGQSKKDFDIEKIEFFGGEHPDTKEKVKGKFTQYKQNVLSAFNQPTVDILQAKTESSLRAMTKAAREAAQPAGRGEGAQTGAPSGTPQAVESATAVAKGSDKVREAILSMLTMVTKCDIEEYENKITNILNQATKQLAKFVADSDEDGDEEETTEITNVPVRARKAQKEQDDKGAEATA